MKRILTLIVLGAIHLGNPAIAAPKDCEALRHEIATRLEANGVRGYSLQIIEPNAPSAGRIVGSCAGGSRQIVYRQVLLGDAALLALLVPPEASRRYLSESSAQEGL